MKITVNGVEVPVVNLLQIDIQVAPGGETLPNTVINATGGKLDCYLSKLIRNGDISLHPFREENPAT